MILTKQPIRKHLTARQAAERLADRVLGYDREHPTRPAFVRTWARWFKTDAKER